MNIMVCVPKNQIDHFWNDECPEGCVENWTLSQRPSKLQPGEFIYFVINRKIVARAEVSGISDQSFTCESTGRQWRGFHVQWQPDDFEKFETARTVVDKGFRGFRYISDRQIERLQGIRHD